MGDKYIIEIPKEFDWHFKKDRFEDALSRLSADAHCLAGNYEKETVDMLINAFKNAIPAADAIEELSKKIDFLMNCIYEAEDALDRGVDNEWARTALEKAEELSSIPAATTADILERMWHKGEENPPKKGYYWVIGEDGDIRELYYNVDDDDPIAPFAGWRYLTDDGCEYLPGPAPKYWMERVMPPWGRERMISAR